MTPWDKEKKLRKTAAWMIHSEEARGVTIWWYPPDLTAKNDDISGPKFSLEDAQTVFEELRTRDLLRIQDEPFFRNVNGEKETHYIAVYLIQQHRKGHWVKLANKGWFGVYITPFFTGLPAITTTVLIFIALAILNGFFSQIGKNSLDWLVRKTFPASPLNIQGQPLTPQQTQPQK